MLVQYDKEVDAVYITFSPVSPVAGIEIQQGVVLHVTERDQIVGLEILNVSKHFPPSNLLTLQVEE